SDASVEFLAHRVHVVLHALVGRRVDYRPLLEQGHCQTRTSDLMLGFLGFWGASSGERVGANLTSPPGDMASAGRQLIGSERRPCAVPVGPGRPGPTERFRRYVAPVGRNDQESWHHRASVLREVNDITRTCRRKMAEGRGFEPRKGLRPGGFQVRCLAS